MLFANIQLDDVILRKVGCVRSKQANGPQAFATMRIMAKKAAAGVPGSTHPRGLDEERTDVDDEQRRSRNKVIYVG